MTKHQKIRKILIFSTLFSLSLLLITPLAGMANTQPNYTRLLTSTISATQTPENLTVGQTWKYRITYQNGTITGSGTFTEKIISIKSITDWNSSTQQCYVFQIRISMDTLLKIFAGINVNTYTTIIVDRYINTTNYSNPRTDTKLEMKTPSGSFIIFAGYLRNATFNIYKFPLSDGLSWQTIVNESIFEWEYLPDGTNNTYPISYQLTSVDASVAGPVNVTVPAGTYETWQINYTDDVMCELFYYIFSWVYGFLNIDEVQGWYSLESGNFVKYFMELDTDENVTIELIPSGLNILLPLILSFSAQQQQGSFNLLLIGGGIVGVIAIVGIAIVLILRRGTGVPSPPESGPPGEWKPT